MAACTGPESERLSTDVAGKMFREPLCARCSVFALCCLHSDTLLLATRVCDGNIELADEDYVIERVYPDVFVQSQPRERQATTQYDPTWL